MADQDRLAAWQRADATKGVLLARLARHIRNVAAHYGDTTGPSAILAAR
ncbi:hypothetical protein ACTOB_002114 [Actinoplanes oblitus]|uniref:Uncharacterized protein n=1 Tax=Actinoplanes oblitus TaxID=3040509 RepID=A0ABY8WLI9_9ACTN|nr:hypothetical protein [Actinoplanes oblitus]WIM98513.1 hypothetical protein ACTOB_002114 [Actinoplanes oblitus]